MISCLESYVSSPGTVEDLCWSDCSQMAGFLCRAERVQKQCPGVLLMELSFQTGISAC